MVVHARVAALARINMAWEMVLVKDVPLIQYLLLVASNTSLVNAMLGTREKVEGHARNAESTNTKNTWERRIALLVL